jgi:hypothetical protein
MGLGKAARAYRADHAVDGDLRIAPSRLKSAANPAGLLPQLPSQPSSLSYVPLSSSPPLLTRPQRSHSEASLLHLTPRPTNKGALASFTRRFHGRNSSPNYADPAIGLPVLIQASNPLIAHLTSPDLRRPPEAPSDLAHLYEAVDKAKEEVEVGRAIKTRQRSRSVGCLDPLGEDDDAMRRARHDSTETDESHPFSLKPYSAFSEINTLPSSVETISRQSSITSVKKRGPSVHRSSTSSPRSPLPPSRPPPSSRLPPTPCGALQEPYAASCSTSSLSNLLAELPSPSVYSTDASESKHSVSSRYARFSLPPRPPPTTAVPFPLPDSIPTLSLFSLLKLYRPYQPTSVHHRP